MKLLPYEEAIAAIRSTPRFFENMIQESLLSNTHGAIVVLKPQPGLNVKADQAVRDKLAAYKAGLTPEELTALVQDTKDIQARQQSVDAPEDLEKLPLLTKEDIEPKQDVYLAEKAEVGGRPAYIYHDFTNQIAYLTLNFNMDYVPEAELPYAGLLASVLGMMDTEHYTYAELDNEIGCRLGDLSTDIRMLEKIDGSFVPYFYMTTKYLMKENKAAFDLMEEVMLHTRMEDVERLGEIVAEERSRMEKTMMRAGHSVAGNRALSYFSPVMAYREKLSGVDFYQFMKDLDDNFEEKAGEAIQHMQKVLGMILCRENLSLRLSCEAEHRKEILQATEALMDKLPAKRSAEASPEVVRVVPEAKNEGLITSGKVQYVARAGHFNQPFHGSMVVLGHILYLDYLWSQVRAQGGAYGCFQHMDRMGRANLVSFRDPNLERTVDVFNQAGPVMEQFECSEREMTKYIIGAIAGLDPVRTPSMKGAAANDRLEMGYTPEMLQQLRDEVLATTPAQIRESAKAMTEAMQDPYICVQGSEKKIKENAQLFDRIITLF